LPDHQKPLNNGRELAIRATKNDKAEMENSTIPSRRRLMLIKHHAAQRKKLNRRRLAMPERTGPTPVGSGD
jgi:hypothetical protein